MNYCDFKHKMLRMVVQKPRVLRDFTEGTLHQVTISTQHVVRWVGELIAEGLVVEVNEMYYPTAEGKAEVNRPTSIASSRYLCAASSRETYRPQWQPTRAGADQHKQYRSVGF